jgi:hypothetical protein
MSVDALAHYRSNFLFHPDAVVTPVNLPGYVKSWEMAKTGVETHFSETSVRKACMASQDLWLALYDYAIRAYPQLPKSLAVLTKEAAAEFEVVVAEIRGSANAKDGIFTRYATNIANRQQLLSLLTSKGVDAVVEKLEQMNLSAKTVALVAD